MRLPDAKYFVLVGNYGSGKTELSLALARRLRREREGRVALVDLDIVNPYFRSAEQSALLESEGVEVLAPTFAMTTVDIPALPAQIMTVFEADFSAVVIDVGGDDTGAVALGAYAPYIAPVRGQMLAMYVVNPFRPLSGTPEDICEMYGLIGARARLKPDWLVNNSNLQKLTTVNDLLEGAKIIQAASETLGVPIGMTAGRAALESQLPPDMQRQYFAFEPLMLPDWMEAGC